MAEPAHRRGFRARGTGTARALHARWLAPVLAAALIGLAVLPASSSASGPCDQPVTNPIACENSLPGDPLSDWEVTGVGDPSLQGFGTSMSINKGQTINFKIKSTAPSYHIDILRLGYYQGNGARKIAAGLRPSAQLPQSQPACLTNSSTGLIDCGNWGVSASWTAPSDAVSGVYIAHLVRDDNGGDSQIPFVVRDDSSHSGMVVQTSDATWQAYNAYGGNSLYSCTVACPPGNPQAYKAAYSVSYNRPFDGSFTTDGGLSYLWYAEYQMIRFLEANGYDVSYTSQADVDRDGSALQNHKVFVSSAHDEYWSGGQRANVEAARDAGVNLAFFSGNEAFWKTRWQPSSDGSATPYRTLTSYKETHFDSPVDPQDPPTWTGTWRDPRFSPPGDGGRPENALTGQYFLVNSGTSDIKVPAQYGKLRFWRNTAAANLSAGQTLTLSPNTGTLGYEWDVDADNGFRPGGLFDLSSSTVSGVSSFSDYGSNLTTSTLTHHLTLYRAPSGALVFGAGTVQWAWGLDNTNAWNSGSTDPSGNPPDPNMQQATVNLFADMGVQPYAPIPGLVPTSASSDTTAPTSVISSPAAGATLQDGNQVTISGTAADTGGGVVAGVEVSTDGGSTWHPASGTANWSYSWAVHGTPSATIMSRAVDDSGNREAPSGISVSVKCPCSLWGPGATPPDVDSGDRTSTEVGVKFKSDTFGTVSGIRFYKSAANTGTHVGSLWSANGQRLAQATFSNETSSGWQQVSFSSPVAISPNTTYVASYFAPQGHYSDAPGYFFVPPPTGGNSLDSPPLHALAANGTSANGVYAYSGTSTFPTDSYNATNYFVDVMFSPAVAPGQVTNVSATAAAGSATVNWTAPSDGGPATSYKITPYIGSTAQPATTVTGSPPATSATIGGLTPGTSYTFTVQASNANGSGPESVQSNAVTPTAGTAPSAPSGVTATAATKSALVSWTAPSDNGGSPITGYTVTPYIGAAAQTPVQTSGSGTSTTVSGLSNGTTYTFKVAATNGIGTGPDSAASNAVMPQSMIFDLATPGQIDSGDPSSVELGVKFTSDSFGTINGIRFYKAAANTGTHIGSLWTAGGQRLAQVTFTNETSSGWQQANFSTPVAISPGTTYVASYFGPNGHYSDTSPGFASAVDNPPLHALANATSADGVYKYSASSAFPTDTFNATNYFVDVLFAPAAAPGQVTNASATAGAGSATVNWTAPSDGGPPTSYKVTPYIGSTAQPATTVTGSPPATSATISGLANGTSYTFTVQASNPSGSGPVSAPSNAVTPTGGSAPSAPSGVTAVAATKSAQVSWTAPSSDGGSPITGSTVTPYVGSTAQTPVQVSGSGTSTIVTGLTNSTAYTFKVAATNGIGTGPQSAASNAVTPQSMIFDFATPAVIDSGDSSSVELGVKFKSDVSGTVAGVRFYKSAANTGSHIGSLWTTGGTRLAQATFANETASGWQRVDFAAPVTVTAGTTYVAAYLAPKGHYSYKASGFSPLGVDNAPLHALANGTSPDGVYKYSATSVFPSSTFNATNYYVDVVFK